MSDPAVPPAPTPPDGAAVRLFLSAVHEALELPLAAWSVHQLRYLRLSERRAFAARASIGRLLADARSSAPDYTSEGDHIRQAIADMPTDTYRHRAARAAWPAPDDYAGTSR